MAIRDDLEELNKYIDTTVINVEKAMTEVQSKAYEIVRNAVLSFEIADNIIMLNSNFYSRLLRIEERLKRLFGSSKYSVPIRKFLSNLNEINDRTIELHVKYNDLKKEIEALPEARKIVYNQAKEVFSSGAIADSYIQPVKNLLARQAVSGMTTKQALSLIEKWNNGELSSGRLNVGNPAPNLNRYAVQMARDTAFSMNRNANDIISKELDLTHFVYVGGLVADSRPLCKHLVSLRRRISLSEIPALVKRYPEGLYPNTTKANFMQVCGGYNCNHTAMGVRAPK